MADLQELFECLRSFVADHYNDLPQEVRITTMAGHRVILPIPCLPGKPPALPEAPEDDWQPFIPNRFQQGILKALEGKAMRTDALGAAVGDRSRLFRKGGLNELKDRGLVEHNSSVGYYRPDAPPPGLHLES